MLNNLIKKNNNVSFHMPGHNKGKGFSRKFRNSILKIDTTELLGNDNLHYPNGIIKKAQEKLSRIFDSRESFFLVNGSTGGILAAAGAVFRKGDMVLLGRDSHVSVFHSIELFELNPIYIYPVINEETGIPMGYDLNEIEISLKEHKEIKGIFITSPNYFGIVSNISEISVLSKKYNIPLILDEAHGAHLKFNKRLPDSGVQSKADIVIQSAHKTLCGMNQGSYMHIMSNTINIEKVKYYLKVFQTTSPSYPIMTSLDETSNILMSVAEEKLEKLIDIVQNFTEKVNLLKGIRVITENIFKGFRKDITRVIIELEFKKSAKEIIEILSEKFNIDVEGEINGFIILIPSMFQKQRDFKKLYKALKEMSENFEIVQSIKPKDPLGFNPEKKYLPHEMLNKEKNEVPLKEAAGMISGSYIVSYPPGVPILVPGEIINDKIIEHIMDLTRKGYDINGVNQGTYQTVSISSLKKG